MSIDIILMKTVNTNIQLLYQAIFRLCLIPDK